MSTTLTTCTNFDLAVVGGGPAGTSAAITAARAGASVLLLERGKLPRQRVCGEFVSAESLALLGDLFNASDLLDQALQISEARLFFDGHTVTTPVEPRAASIARLDLDIALWHSAENERVTAKLETRVNSIAGSGPFTLSTSDGTFEARAIVNAAGRWSNLHAWSVLKSNDGPAKGKWLGVKAHYSERDPRPSVDLYFFDGGYCGVQPVSLEGSSSTEGRVNACAMVRADVARSLPEIFELHPRLRLRVRNWRQLGEPVTTSPLIFREPTPVENGILLAGDAAGFVDPFVGDGISLALRSGSLAAHSLSPFFQGQSTLEHAAMQYSQDYRERLLPIFRNSSRLRRLLSLPRPIRRSVGHLLEATPAVSRFLVRWTR
jgi:menaquinone-9 beta-reductase